MEEPRIWRDDYKVIHGFFYCLGVSAPITTLSLLKGQLYLTILGKVKYIIKINFTCFLWGFFAF